MTGPGAPMSQASEVLNPPAQSGWLVSVHAPRFVMLYTYSSFCDAFCFFFPFCRGSRSSLWLFYITLRCECAWPTSSAPDTQPPLNPALFRPYSPRARVHTAQGGELVRSRGQQTSGLLPPTGEEGEGALRGGQGAKVQRVAATERRDRESAAEERGEAKAGSGSPFDR